MVRSYIQSQIGRQLPRVVFEDRVKRFNNIDSRFVMTSTPYLDECYGFGIKLYLRYMNVVVEVLVLADYSWYLLSPMPTGSWLEKAYNVAYNNWINI